MESYRFMHLVPSVDSSDFCGGQLAILQINSTWSKVSSSQCVTYKKRSNHYLFLDDILTNDINNVIFVIHWGPDMVMLNKKLHDQLKVFYIHSAADHINYLPKYAPVITVSRYSMGCVANTLLHNPIYYLPNIIADKFIPNRDLSRDIDILVIARKQSGYLLDELLPILKKKFKVMVINKYVDNLVPYYQRSKIYIYDSVEYWQSHNSSEGFGLQPLEALCCGCSVISTVNGGLSDYIEPGLNSYSFVHGAHDYNLKTVEFLLKKNSSSIDTTEFSRYREANQLAKITRVLNNIIAFYVKSINLEDFSNA